MKRIHIFCDLINNKENSIMFNNTIFREQFRLLIENMIYEELNKRNIIDAKSDIIIAKFDFEKLLQQINKDVKSYVIASIDEERTYI